MVVSEASRLEPVLGQLLAYGSERPDVFGSYGVVWHDDGTASAFASFVGDLDGHRAALSTWSTIPTT